MSRDIKIYLLIVVLPAVLLVAGGIRLVSFERERARTMVVDSLNARAVDLAQLISVRLREKGCKCRDFKPPRPPPPDAGGWKGWRFQHEQRPGEGCKFHELPQDVSETIRETLESQSDAVPGAVEVRHGCGCTIVHGSKGVIVGVIYGSAPIKPMLPSYSVCVAPAGGDEAVALGAMAQAMFAAILVFLLFGTLAAGVILLARAARRAREEARAKTDFLSNVSHELKTPLTSIAMFSEMLQSGGLSGDAVKKASGTISRESKRLGRLIDGLLEYARLERGARKYDISEFAVMPILEDAVAAFAPSFPEGISFSADSDRNATIVADRDALRRIIDCLLENAVKYASCAPIELCVVSGSDGVEISVADRGPGIPENDAKFIFDRFWRADNSVTRSTGGTGLGLAIACELANGMGAKLSYSPNSLNGAVFTIIFKHLSARKQSV